MEWQREPYMISDDRKRLNLDAVCRLVWGTYWAVNRGRGVIARSVRNSLCFGIYHGAEQVGLARVVTDKATVGYICDVVISEEHRGRGLGKWLLACILEHPDLQECRLDLFTRDAQELYKQFGFGPHRFTSMVRYPPERQPAP
jgi:GNAT superfamily N-acetyltransferase